MKQVFAFHGPSALSSAHGVLHVRPFSFRLIFTRTHRVSVGSRWLACLPIHFTALGSASTPYIYRAVLPFSTLSSIIFLRSVLFGMQEMDLALSFGIVYLAFCGGTCHPIYMLFNPIHSISNYNCNSAQARKFVDIPIYTSATTFPSNHS
jgi:hypothetical protein